jgi:ATP-dependent Clp protease ATP-binding subunit ClpC
VFGRPEHILLGLLAEGEGVALQVLAELGVDLAALRQSVLARAARSAP